MIRYVIRAITKTNKEAYLAYNNVYFWTNDENSADIDSIFNMEG